MASTDEKTFGLFQGSLAGDSRPRRDAMTLAAASDHVLPAAVSCGLNAAGGALAQGLDAKIDEWKPGAGTLGIALLSIAIKTFIQPVSEVMIAVREVAAGMAGWVGDELFEGLVLWWRSEPWKAGKVHTKGSFVRHGGKYYQAAQDIPAEGAEPGKDERWLKITTVAYSLSDVQECARLVLMDKGKSELIANFLAARLGQNGAFKDEAARADAAKQIKDAMGLLAVEFNKGDGK